MGLGFHSKRFFFLLHAACCLAPCCQDLSTQHARQKVQTDELPATSVTGFGSWWFEWASTSCLAGLMVSCLTCLRILHPIWIQLGHLRSNLRSNLRSRKIDFFGTVFFLGDPMMETTGSEADHFARPAGWHRALADRAAWSPRCGWL